MSYRLLSLLLLLSFSSFSQQKKLNGYMIYMLGNDTTMAGSYSLTGNDFEVTVLSRPNVTVTKMKGSFFPNGELKTAEGFAYKPLLNGDTQMITRYSLFVKGDTTFITANNTTQKFAFRGMLSNAMGTPFRFMLPFWSVYGPKKVGDSVVSHHLTFGTGRPLVLKRISANKIYGGSNVMGNFTFFLDKEGNIVYIDGIGSSWNTTAKLLPALDLDALTKNFLLNEKSGQAITVINQLDSVTTRVSSTDIKIYYSRPQVRGRKIFGAVVPWDRFWRTGANAATKLIINQPLHFDGKVLPAGEYSVWTIPSAERWVIMFNSKANIWGTEYDPSFDVLKVPMQVSSSKTVTELFTITVEADPTDTTAGTLNIIWENKKASLKFSVSR